MSIEFRQDEGKRFFEVQLSSPIRTFEPLKEEGIETLEDVTEIDKRNMKNIAKTSHKPGETIEDPHLSTSRPRYDITPPFKIGTKPILRMSRITCAMKY